VSALEAVTLWTHVAAGSVALVAGAAALLTEKGCRRHRRAGRAFVRSMAVVVATVFALLALDPTSFRVFLALVAVFSGYFVASGDRVLARKRPADDPAAVDWALASVTATACLALAGWGVASLASGTTFGLVLVVFGGLGTLVAGGDLWQFGPGTDPHWLGVHLTRMPAAVVATVSAVSAVNLTPMLGVAAWLWPTPVGVAPLA
jgi:hypothetical protein